jgi:hypothetical protein
LCRHIGQRQVSCVQMFTRGTTLRVNEQVSREV